MEKRNRLFSGKLFENNKFVLLISLLAAFVFWMVITITATPEAKNTINNININISTENSVVEELGLDVVSKLETVSAKVVGPTYVISSLSREDISVTASLANVTSAGSFTLDLRATKRTTNVSNEYEIVSISPSSVNVTFDYIDTKQFTVLAKANGASAIEGLSAEDAIVANSHNSTVSIKGPRTEIEKISKVVAVCDVNSVLSKTETFGATLKLLDENDKELSAEKYTIVNAENQPVDNMEITVPIFKVKQVPITAQFVNAPKSYSEKPIPHTLSDSSILISGQPEMIDSITSISLSPIDFDNISKGNYSFTSAVILPEGIKSAEKIETVTVTIDNIKSYSSKTLTVSNISVTTQGVNATLDRSIRNVTIMGPRAVINSLSSSNIYAEVDATGKQSGKHTVSVRIRSKNSDAIWQVGTYSAAITVK